MFRNRGPERLSTDQSQKILFLRCASWKVVPGGGIEQFKNIYVLLVITPRQPRRAVAKTVAKPVAFEICSLAPFRGVCIHVRPAR